MQEQEDINTSYLRNQQEATAKAPLVESLALGLLTAGTNLGNKHWRPEWLNG